MNNVVETAEYSNTSSPSERIGTNYSTSSLFLTLKTIGDLSAIQQNQDEYKLQIKKRWEMFKQAYVKDSKFFLKIDTSKLPLWTFNMTSQVLDNINDTIKNNFDNKITTTYAYAKYYNGQSFSWKKCEILSYDPITNMYSIEFIDSKNTFFDTSVNLSTDSTATMLPYLLEVPILYSLFNIIMFCNF